MQFTIDDLNELVNNGLKFLRKKDADWAINYKDLTILVGKREVEHLRNFAYNSIDIGKWIGETDTMEEKFGLRFVPTGEESRLDICYIIPK